MRSGKKKDKMWCEVYMGWCQRMVHWRENCLCCLWISCCLETLGSSKPNISVSSWYQVVIPAYFFETYMPKLDSLLKTETYLPEIHTQVDHYNRCTMEYDHLWETPMIPPKTVLHSSPYSTCILIKIMLGQINKTLWITILMFALRGLLTCLAWLWRCGLLVSGEGSLLIISADWTMTEL
jgi:hypothetical protein